MKIQITTERLPNKYPKGEIYEVAELEGALLALVSQEEAIIVGEEKVEEVVVDEKEVKAKLKEELKERGISVKGNPKLETLEKMLDESKKK